MPSFFCSSCKQSKSFGEYQGKIVLVSNEIYTKPEFVNVCSKCWFKIKSFFNSKESSELKQVILDSFV